MCSLYKPLMIGRWSEWSGCDSSVSPRIYISFKFLSMGYRVDELKKYSNLKFMVIFSEKKNNLLAITRSSHRVVTAHYHRPHAIAITFRPPRRAGDNSSSRSRTMTNEWSLRARERRRSPATLTMRELARGANVFDGSVL